MATKKFTKHAQRELNKNPNVVKCTEAKISFSEEFALKVVDALKKGEDPYQVFTDNGLSVRILGKSRINGVIGLWKSKYELENLPRRKVERAPKEPVETAQEKREKNLRLAIEQIDALRGSKEGLGLDEEADEETVLFAAIKRVYDESKTKVVIRDVLAHYDYPYPHYYNYLKSLEPKEEFVNPLNPHRKDR